MIKLTIKALVDATTPVQDKPGALTRFLTAPMTSDAGWANRKLGPSADAELTAFFKLRDELIARYEGKTDPATSLVTFEGAKAQEFAGEYNTLLAKEAELNGMPIKRSDLLRPDFSPSDWALLDKFFADDELPTGGAPV
jgi:hypothetical protein